MSHARAWPACLPADLGRGAQPLEEEEEEEADAMAIDDEDTWHEEEDGEDIKIRPITSSDIRTRTSSDPNLICCVFRRRRHLAQRLGPPHLRRVAPLRGRYVLRLHVAGVDELI